MRYRIEEDSEKWNTLKGQESSHTEIGFTRRVPNFKFKI